MKRLTSEDQERVMRSRALPETFHDIDGLHSGHSRQSQYFGDSSIVHPSQTINDEGSFYQGLRRRNGGSLAGYPLSVKSNLDELHRGSGPTLASEMMSPISLTHDSPQLPPSSTTNLADLLPISSASRSRSFPLINQSQPFSPNLKFQDQSSRRRAGSLASPQGMDWHSSEGLWDRTTSQVTGLGISSSATTMFDNSYVNGPDAVRVPENFHFSSVQNVYAPEIHLSMPSDGQWHGARHSVPSPNANNLLALSSDLNTQLTAESLASYSNLYHPSLPREESLHVQQNFPTPQAAIPCQSMTREAQFPVNYSGDISQEFQPLPMRELGTEELSISPYHTNSSFIP